MDRQPDCAVDVSPRWQRGQGDVPDPDPYLPGHGDLAYEVESYQIELDYPSVEQSPRHPSGDRRGGQPVDDPYQAGPAGPGRPKGARQRSRPARYSLRAGKLRIRLAAPAAAGDRLELVIRYGGQPGPVPSIWGDVGWQELSDGVIVAGQPGGAPS